MVDQSASQLAGQLVVRMDDLRAGQLASQLVDQSVVRMEDQRADKLADYLAELRAAQLVDRSGVRLDLMWVGYLADLSVSQTVDWRAGPTVYSTVWKLVVRMVGNWGRWLAVLMATQWVGYWD